MKKKNLMKVALCLVFVLITTVNSITYAVNRTIDPIQYSKIQKPQKTLSSKELTQLLSDWDEAMKSGSWHDRDRQFTRIIKRVDTNASERLTVIAYSNPELLDRLASLYIYEFQTFLKRESVGQGLELTSKEKSNIPWCGGENGMDYIDVLTFLAHLTLSPEIYDYVWRYPQSGGLRSYYLAHVMPEETLKKIFAAKVGKWKKRNLDPDSLYISGYDMITAISVKDAFEILSVISNNDPNMASDYHDSFISFVNKHSLHYSKRKIGKAYPRMDYSVRLNSIEILQNIGQEKDLPQLNFLLSEIPPAKPNSYTRHKRKNWPSLPDAAQIAINRIERRKNIAKLKKNN